MTRCRCDHDSGVPNQLLVDYYAQRASAGFIFTECAAIAPNSNAFPNSAKIYTKSHADGWTNVVDAVHSKGSKIFIQLWHSGRATHSKL